MKIESILIPVSQAASVGLQEVKLSKLGRVVLVAGRNGSGKSRFLNLLQAHVNTILGIGEMSYLIERKKQYNNYVAGWVAEQQSIEQQLEQSPNGSNNVNLRKYYTTLQRQIDEYKKDIEDVDDKASLLAMNKIIGRANTVKYVPLNSMLTDSNTLTPNQLQEYANYASNPDMEKLRHATLAKIQAVQTKWFYATHQASKVPIQERQQAIEDYERLQIFIKRFIDADLEIDLNSGVATLFGKPLGKAMFSQGQRVLLQFCIALYTQDTALSDLVLILDEPENHLHPSAMNEVLDRLRSVVTNGQIWIATHSVNVLAHFQEETLLYMENGAISYAGNDTMKVLGGLLGDEEEREKLSGFLALPFVMSGTRFAYESLMGAAVVMTGVADPQMQQIREALSAARAGGTCSGRLKTLDFGAGKGRLAATLHEMAELHEPLSNWLDYVAYDPDTTNAVECRNNIERAYIEVGHRYYNDLSELRQRQLDGTFDLVILTNVFHEIPPEKWTETLSSDIYQLLKPSGKLIIVEDQRLAHGEHAHNYGFLLFDTLEFYKLFAITPADVESEYYSFIGEQRGRLKDHYIAPELLRRVTNGTRKEALKELVINSRKKIEQIRGLPATNQNGRLHAFWLHQFANAQLAIEALG